jgi:hypothetical protein
MRLTRGERIALLFLVPIVIGFLPPVTGWAAGVEGLFFGLPFLIFWSALMVIATATLMSIAYVVKKRVDGQ